MSASRRTSSLPPQFPPDHVGALGAGVVMALGGWWGLYTLLTTALPSVGQRWAFFVLLQLAVAGTVLPLVRWVNVRFTPLDKDLPPSGVLVRQALWVGLYAATCAWLQIPRTLTITTAVVLALALTAIEGVLLVNERRARQAMEDGL